MENVPGLSPEVGCFEHGDKRLKFINRRATVCFSRRNHLHGVL